MLTYQAFIGSSKEHLRYAEAIQYNLERANIDNLEAICWPNIFSPGKFTLEAILDALNRSTFGVFILAPDDYIEIRDQPYKIPRDNVILEMGMFIAGVGRERTFYLVPQKKDDPPLRLPTDLDGITTVSYAADKYGDNISAQVSSACLEIKESMRNQLREISTKAAGLADKEEPGNIIEDSKEIGSRSVLDEQLRNRIKSYRGLIK